MTSAIEALTVLTTMKGVKLDREVHREMLAGRQRDAANGRADACDPAG